MKLIFRILLVLPGILFVVSGIRWWVDPTAAAAQLGMPLLNGVGLSSQAGDLAAFFLLLGLFILAGVVTAVRHWFYAPVALLLLAAVSRVVAWAIHDATLALHLIVPEVLIAVLVWVVSKYYCRQAGV